MRRIAPLALVMLVGCSYTQISGDTPDLGAFNASAWNFVTDRSLTITKNADGFTGQYTSNPNAAGTERVLGALDRALGLAAAALAAPRAAASIPAPTPHVPAPMPQAPALPALVAPEPDVWPPATVPPI